MVKNIKKRSVSESEVVEKKAEVTGNVNKAFKKGKVENKAMQNGQGDKQIRKDVPQNVKVGVKKNAGVVHSFDKSPKDSEKQKVDNKETQGKKKNKGMSSDLTIDQINAKIESITGRNELSRSAKRKLAFLRKLLKVKGGTYEQDKQQPQNVKNQKSVQVVVNKQVQNKAQNKKVQGKMEAQSKNQNKKKDAKQENQFIIKTQKEEDEEDEEEMDSEESEDESDVEEQVVEKEEEEEEEDESEEEAEEEEEESEDEEDENENDKIKTNNVQTPKEKIQNNEAEAKKKRYVAFVGNLPYTVTSDEIKKHFLTKVSNIVNIRIPTKDGNQSRGFAYVEFANNADFEKAFTLHHSMLNGRRINVQYSGANRKEGVAKNFKLQALQKAGKFGGGRNRPYQKNFGNKERK